MNTNTMNRNPKLKHYVTSGGDLQLGRLIDDAVAVLEDIHTNGVGLQRARSRSHFLAKIDRMLMAHGYTLLESRRVITEQIIPIFQLNINAEE